MNKILKLSAKDEWRHCLGEDNAADIGSKGALGSKLKDEELWWRGPPWLTQEESRWPTSQVITSTPESQEEMKKDVNCNDCGRTRLSLYCKGSRYWATRYLITLYSYLIISDNAKTFEPADKALKKLFNHPEVANELSSKIIEWKFNSERAPWWGGFFERMVGCVKRCLRKVLGNARLTYASSIGPR